MDRERIGPMIVVEGKNDSLTLKRWFDCDTIETNGSAVPEAVLERIALALGRRGVIVFTDPDYPGDQIRKIIDREVPGCSHAFLPKADAIDVKKGKVGIEHAGYEALREALSSVRTPGEEAGADPSFEPVPLHRLTEAGLLDGPDARLRRRILGDCLGIGYNNSKQLPKRLHQFRISLSEFEKAQAAMIKEMEQLER